MENVDVEAMPDRDGSTGRRSRGVRMWTRRVHFYLGLYLLLFIWLFSISGLFLNNSHWEFTRFWDRRQESTVEMVISAPAATSDLAIAKELMRQLGIAGEIQEITRTPADGGFRFQAGRPGETFRVGSNLATGRTTVTRIDVNAVGVLNALHTFSGVRMNTGLQRDWWLTRIWSFSMDAVAVGLMILVFSGVYLWLRLKRKRVLGIVALGLGAASCGFFLVGLTGVY